MGKRGLALRGHRENISGKLNAGNFLEFLQLVSKYNDRLKDHLNVVQKKHARIGRGKTKEVGRGSKSANQKFNC